MYGLNSVNITATQVAKNYFSAYVENDFIYSYSVYGERQQVGVTNDAYTALQKTAQEALDKAEKYYQRLVELGDIVPLPMDVATNLLKFRLFA